MQAITYCSAVYNARYSNVTLNSDLFTPKYEAYHLCPKMHQCYKFGENPSNISQDIMLVFQDAHMGEHTDRHDRNITLAATLVGRIIES